MSASKKLVTGLVTGAAMGAVAGLLLAPKPGRVTRRFVTIRANRIRNMTGEYIGSLRQKNAKN
jgi:gas vesicle protein